MRVSLPSYKGIKMYLAKVTIALTRGKKNEHHIYSLIYSCFCRLKKLFFTPFIHIVLDLFQLTFPVSLSVCGVCIFSIRCCLQLGSAGIFIIIVFVNCASQVSFRGLRGLFHFLSAEWSVWYTLSSSSTYD